MSFTKEEKLKVLRKIWEGEFNKFSYADNLNGFRNKEIRKQIRTELNALFEMAIRHLFVKPLSETEKIKSMTLESA